ncbi:MAG: phenylacetate--CoA ligase family protein [Candidatus Heimdallarchaeota archaeon]
MVFDKLIMFLIKRRIDRMVNKLSGADQAYIAKQLHKLNPKTLAIAEKYYTYTGLLHAAENSPYYQKTLPPHLDGMTLSNARSYIEKLPFTTTTVLSKDSEQFLAIPKSEVVSVHFTYGSTGNKKTLYNSKRDAATIDYSYKLGFLLCGIKENDIAQIVYSFGVWALAERIQRTTLQMSIITLATGNYTNFKEQQEFIEKFNVTTIFGTPSYVYNLAREIDLPQKYRDQMRVIMLGGEGLPEHRRKIIEERLGGEVYINYGLNEVGGGLGSECKEHNGYHIFPTAILEIIDPKTGKVLKNGEYGELVLTTLRREAMPLIRYRTGDITRIIDEPCPCGLKLARIDYLKGRADDRIIIGAAEKYYPIDFDLLFDKIKEIKDYWIEVVTENDKDSMKVHVLADKPSDELKQKIIDTLYSMDSIKIDIETTKTVNIPDIIFIEKLPTGAKRRRLVDKRKLVKK